MRAYGLEFTSETIDRIQQTLHEAPSVSKRFLARSVCQWMDWRAVSGRLKEAVCRKALTVLDGQGYIDLGKHQVVGKTKHEPKPPAISVDTADITCDLGALGRIELQMVTSRYSKSFGIWKALLDQHHYLGSGPLFGGQIRYLIHSAVYGYLGALSFGSASRALKDRDKFIGWTERARINNIQRVVCNTRFLIVPTVRVANLASHILSRCTQRISRDWMSRYGSEPVAVETFVDPQRFFRDMLSRGQLDRDRQNQRSPGSAATRRGKGYFFLSVGTTLAADAVSTAADKTHSQTVRGRSC